jgi:hypothetical protein
VHAIFELAPIIADIVNTRCSGTRAREEFMRACLGNDWPEAKAMVEGMLAEPWRLKGYQENRLREFLELVDSACCRTARLAHHRDEYDELTRGTNAAIP